MQKRRTEERIKKEESKKQFLLTKKKFEKEITQKVNIIRKNKKAAKQINPQIAIVSFKVLIFPMRSEIRAKTKAPKIATT